MYDIRPGNGAGLFLQSPEPARGRYGIGTEVTVTSLSITVKQSTLFIVQLAVIKTAVHVKLQSRQLRYGLLVTTLSSFIDAEVQSC